ncbi:ficolin-2-like [Cylas formicarius]|uniref:ficolin-2-like n=1 Tax=Cylas formicarius TaxID=197179 RepID=UPI0029588DC1|nr:ficolin-2-like [Cylas formicarius]
MWYLSRTMRFLLAVLVLSYDFCFASALTTPTPTRESCDVSGLDGRLAKLEALIAEKSDIARAQIDNANRRLQHIERQTYLMQNAFDECRNQARRSADGTQTTLRHAYRDKQEAKVETRLEGIAKSEQLSLVALRMISADLEDVGKNVSGLSAVVGEILSNLAPKQGSPQKPTSPPRNCREIQNGKSGVHLVYPVDAEPLMVFCDMESTGGGWLVIHNRHEGSQDFYLGWEEYKNGFGNLAGEFWLGLENVYRLTGRTVHELLVELVDVNKIKTSAHYAVFGIGSEAEGYSLKLLGGYQGDAGDSLAYHAGSRFTTKDKDQDGWFEGNCAMSHRGAWWYRACDTSNLNGAYAPGDLPDANTYQGMYWRDFRGPQYGLLQARMMIRPRDGGGPTVTLGGTANL